jgi:hypothetical protein
LLKSSFAADFITPKLPLRDGETLISASRSFELGFFSVETKRTGTWEYGIRRAPRQLRGLQTGTALSLISVEF